MTLKTNKPNAVFHKTNTVEPDATPRLHVLRNTAAKATRGGMLALAGLLSTTSLSFAIDAAELPQGGVVASGSATFDYSQPNTLNVNQASQNALIDWKTFNIGEQAATHFYQPGATAIAVNRVHDVNPSQILGTLTGNGQVIVLNQNGVFFGSNAHVDVAGLMVSTGEIDANAFNNSGAVKLSNINANPNAKIVNKGSISIKDGGLAAFVAPSIVNDGVITAKLGKVALAAGADKATVDLYGDGLVELALDDKASKALIENTGKISAEGGTIAMTAAAAKEVVDSVINMGGVVEANAISEKGGKIILGATNADIKVTGKITAKGGAKGPGGKIDIRSNKNIAVANTAELNADAGQKGHGGTIDVIADKTTDFRGSVFARGGSESGNGGSVEISGYEALGFDGYADLSAANGSLGTLLLDPAFAVIHSGVINNPLGLNIVLSAQALANSMKNSNVTVSATSFIDVGTGFGPYNTGIGLIDNILNALVGTGPINLSTWNNGGTGTTNGSLTLAANTINFNKNVTMGNGNLAVNANTVNLGSKLYANGGATLLGDARLSSNANTVNVRSNAASIQQGLDLANDAGGATVNVNDGTYTENLTINKSLTLRSVNGASNTTINGISGVGAAGTVFVANGANNVTIGQSGRGFMINGFDNGNPGIENATIYLQGNHNNVLIQNNNIVANGDLGLLTEYGATVDGLTVDKNIISGQSFVGAAPAMGNQFTVPNVARPVVYIAGTNKSNINFTGNIITANSGASGIGNSTVMIASTNGAVTNNIFTSTAGALSANLVVRGSGLDVSKNIMTGHGVSGGMGIAVENGSNMTVSENIIDNMSVAVYVAGGANNTLSKNIISNSFAHGVWVDTSSNTAIADNNITTSGQNGLFLKKVTTGTVNNNTIGGTNSNGIGLELTSDVDVTNNTLTSIGGDGINLYYGNTNAEIYGNTIQAALVGVHLDTAGGQFNANTKIGKAGAGNTIFGGTIGVQIAGGDDNAVNSNTIQNTANQGVLVANTENGVTISDNIVHDTGASAIQLNGGNLAYISGNTVYNTVGNGIALFGSHENTVTGNYVGYTDSATIGAAGNIKGDGIHFNDVDDSFITNNKVANTQSTGGDIGSGIFVGYGSDNTTITGNILNNIDWDGIKLANGTLATISNNIIDNVTRVGIYLGNAFNTSVNNNTVTNGKLNGYGSIHADYGADVTINNNLVDAASGHGIGLYNVGGKNQVSGNTIDNTAQDGINSVDTKNVVVLNNNIGQTGTIGGDGIFVSGLDASTGLSFDGVNGLRISGNNVNGATFNGIFIANATGSNASFGTLITTSNNTVTNSGDDGIQFDTSSYVMSLDDTVSNSGDANIKLLDVSNVNVLGATLTDGIYGVYADNADNANIGGGGIYDNTITSVDYDGVYVANSDNVSVYNNAITNAVHHGVSASNNTGLTIVGNTISNVGVDGIYVTGGTKVTIGSVPAEQNVITLAGDDGIDVENVNGLVTISYNNVDGVSNNGIELSGTTNGVVDNNTVANAGWDGINVQQSSNVNVTNNGITNTIGASGIAVWNGVSNALIDTNTIADSKMLGIYTGGNSNLTISNNTVTNSGNGNIAGVNSGIQVEATNGVTVTGNTITSASGDGINLGDSINYGVGTNTGTVIADGNTINGAGRDGIYIIGSTDATISNNTIAGSSATIIPTAGAAHDAIHAENTDGITIEGNTIAGSSGGPLFGGAVGANRYGIYVADSSDAVINENTFQGGNGGVLFTNGGQAVLQDGIFVDNSDDADITNNHFLGGSAGVLTPGGQAADNGITVVNSAGAFVDSNDVNFVTGNGINFDTSTDATISNNEIGTTGVVGGDGVSIVDGDTIEVSGNTIDTNVQGDGIFIDPSLNITLISNLINNVGGTGIYVAGQGNRTITLSGNTVNSLAANNGAEFESGTIDLTGASNTFNGGTIGMLFDPTAGGNPLGLTLVNDSIGTTAFNGQSQYYVDLENGAFFAPGTPTNLNGYGATFDGLTASAMTAGQYNALLSMIHDYLDDNTLGLFFPLLNSADINDVLPQRALLSVAVYRSPLLTITGLPFAPGERIPTNILNGLNTAAGLNAVSTAAGGTQVSVQSTPTNNNIGDQFAANLNAVDTAAGGAVVGCWGGVYNRLSTGVATPVTYDFNTNPVVQLNDQSTAGCGGV